MRLGICPMCFWGSAFCPAVPLVSFQLPPLAVPTRGSLLPPGPCARRPLFRSLHLAPCCSGLGLGVTPSRSLSCPPGLAWSLLSAPGALMPPVALGLRWQVLSYCVE